MLFGITTSGRSANVVRALRAAREMGIVTVGLLGGPGEPALGLCDHALLVPDSRDGAHPGMPHGVGSRRAGIAGGPSGGASTVTILLTGAAGFIGYHVAEALLARGERVLGVDNLNAYYDVRLKQARLAQPGWQARLHILRSGRGRSGGDPWPRPSEQRHERRSFIWPRRRVCGIRWQIRIRMFSRM